MTQSNNHPEFLAAWRDAIAYIAKGAGNWHTLLGQKLSIPGLHIRMMKGSANAYEHLSKIKGRKFVKVSDYDLAFVYQEKTFDSSKSLRTALQTGISFGAATGIVGAIITFLLFSNPLGAFGFLIGGGFHLFQAILIFIASHK